MHQPSPVKAFPQGPSSVPWEILSEPGHSPTTTVSISNSPASISTHTSPLSLRFFFSLWIYFPFLNSFVEAQPKYSIIRPFKVYSPMVYLVYSRPCANITTVHFRTFSSSRKENSCLLPITTPHPFSPTHVPKQPLTYFLSPQICLFWTFVGTELHTRWTSVTDFFHLT